MLKRGYVGTYHRMSPKHLHRYVDEFAGRHNVRTSQIPSTRCAAMVRGMDGKRLALRSADCVERTDERGVSSFRDQNKIRMAVRTSHQACALLLRRDLGHCWMSSLDKTQKGIQLIFEALTPSFVKEI